MSADRGDFFVGYLPMTPASRRSTLLVGATALLLMAVGAFLAASTQEDPGPGVRPHRPGEAFVGLYGARPYPHLRYVAEDGSVRTLLLVSAGKAGIPAGAAEDGEVRKAVGTLIERDGSRVLAGPSFSAPEAVDATLGRRLADLADEDLGEVRLEGEIVDSKCYLGAMRPGGGRAHRACAQMCIAGGIPPVLVLRGEDGSERHVLLCSREEAPIHREVLPYVAEPVAVEGRLLLRAGLLVLRTDPERIRRL